MATQKQIDFIGDLAEGCMDCVKHPVRAAMKAAGIANQGGGWRKSAVSWTNAQVSAVIAWLKANQEPMEEWDPYGCASE